MKPEMLVPVARQLLAHSQARGAQATDLARALARGRPVSWSDGELMCFEGDPSEDLYLVIRGQIRVLRNDASGIPRELVTLSPPNLVGHMGLVDGSPRSATCEAAGDVAGLCLDRNTFRGLMDDASAAGTSFRRLILSNMMLQLSNANRSIRQLVVELEGAELDQHRADAEKWRRDMREQAIASRRPSEAERLRRIAGALDGWDLRTENTERVRFVEDEDMRRTRHAREKGSK
jgi:CRP/FNR family cyclic AMP-dependent transcriptional regulator